MRRKRSVALCFHPRSVKRKDTGFLICENIRSTKKQWSKFVKSGFLFLINPAFCFFLTRVLYDFRRGKVYDSSQLSRRVFIFWYLWKTNAYTVNQFYNDCMLVSSHVALFRTGSVCTGKRWCFCRLSVCLDVVFDLIYDNRMDMGWESTDILLFRLRYSMLSDTAVLGKNKCLIWSICLPAAPPPVLGIADFRCHLSQHNKNTSHVPCGACRFSLKTVNPNCRAHRSNSKLIKASFHTNNEGFGWDFVAFNKHQYLRQQFCPKALQGFVTTCPDHDIDCNMYRGRL